MRPSAIVLGAVWGTSVSDCFERNASSAPRGSAPITRMPGRSDFAAIAQPEIKERLRANTDELIRRGGFGSPTLFVDGDDMYFGNDRLVLVRDALRAAAGRAQRAQAQTGAQRGEAERRSDERAERSGER